MDHKTEHISLRISTTAHKLLGTIATSEDTNISQLVRKYVTKGLRDDGYLTPLPQIKSSDVKLPDEWQ
jgi:hypothetical protein